MAVDQVLATLAGLLADPGQGLAAKVNALAAAKGHPAGRIRTDYREEYWQVSASLRESNQPSYALVPRGTQALQLPFGQTRDSRHAIACDYEVVDADLFWLQESVALTATGLMQSLDGVEAYSSANGGTIVLLEDPVDIQFGAFDARNPAASGGFRATFNVLERSTL